MTQSEKVEMYKNDYDVLMEELYPNEYGVDSFENKPTVELDNIPY